jgi:hypothetical protein
VRSPHAGDGVAQGNGLAFGGQTLFNLRAHARHRLVQNVEVGQRRGQQEGVVGSAAPDDGLGQAVALGTEPAACQLGTDVAVGLAAHEGLQDGTRGHAAHLGHNGRALAVGIREHRLHAVDASRPLLEELEAVAREGTPVARRGGQEQAPASQSVAPPLGGATRHPCRRSCAPAPLWHGRR